MPILVVCEVCGKKLKAPDDYAGRKAKCAQCGNIIHIGIPADAEPQPQPKPPEREERAQRLPTKPKAQEPEEAESVEPGDELEKPKKKKKKKKKRRSQPEQSVPEWVWWTGGLLGTIAAMFIAAAVLFQTGHPLLVTFIALRVAIMMPISIVILIISLVISSAIVGGIDFSELSVVIPKALILLLVTSPIYAIPCIGGFLALPIWFIGLMLVFRLEIWETRVLVAVNWVLNWVAFVFVLSLIINLIGLAARLPGDLKIPLPHRAANRQEAIDLKAIQSLGGSYEPEVAENPDSPIVEISLSGSRATDADLIPVTHFSKLKVLKLDKTQITDSGLAKLKGLAELKNLDLSRTRITDAGLEHLKDMKQLEILSLAGTSVTNDGVKKLREALPKTDIVSREQGQ
ncbi:MAG TPA: hypothetical protein VK395_15400 [Gemmataceae bacterium]|nr:hypothetical protein [Gemmataceae bacterium]